MAIDKGFQWSSDPQMALRMQLAQGLMQGGQAPAQGFGENAANLGSKLIGAYMAKKVMDEGKGREQAKNDTLANALRAGQGQAAETKTYGDGTAINWDERKADPQAMAAILAGNQDTAPMGMQMQIGQMDERRKNEAATAAALLEHNRAIERDRMKPIDVTDGKQWFVPDMPGQAPPAPAPMAPAPQAAPQAVATAPPVPLTPTGGSGPMGPNSNNPGNIRTSDGNAWQGKTTQPGSQFERFDTPENGVRAMGVLVSNYAKQGVNTLGGIVSKWAPPNENQTDALITNAAKRTGLDPNQPLDMNDPAVRGKVVQALLMQEQGKVPYGQDVVQAGVNASFGHTAQAPATHQGVQVADASGAIPASALAPQGPQRMTVGGQSGTVIGGQGGPKVRSMTAEELAQNGFPKDALVQVDRDGRQHIVRKGGEGGGGPFGGNGLPAQDSNILVNGDPSSPEYALAYMRATETRFVPVQDPNDPTRTVMTAITPKLPPNIRPPAHLAQGTATPKPQAAPGATDTVPNPLQTTDAAPAAPAAPESQFTATPIPGTERGGSMSPGERKEINTQIGTIDKVDGALTALADDVAKNGMQTGGLGGKGGRQSSLFQDVMLQLKEAQNLGVLNGPDERILLEQLANPTSIMTYIRGLGGPEFFAEKLKAVQEKLVREKALLNKRINPNAPDTKPGDKPATPTTIMRFDAEGNIVQ